MCLAAAFFGSSAYAEPPPPEAVQPANIAPGETPQVSGQHDPGVKLRLTPYAWLTAYNGNLIARGVSVDVDASFSDVLDSTDTIVGLMGAVDIEFGRFVFQFNGAYAQAEVAGERGRASNGGAVSADATVDVEASNTWLELFAGYRLFDAPVNSSGRFSLDAFAGVRHTRIDTTLGVTSSLSLTLPGGENLVAGVERELQQDQDWFEPFVGLRAGLSLDDHWRIALRGDIGGFDVDGDSFAWQTLALLGYEWKLDSGGLGVFAGYRALGQDYQDGAFAWDVVTHGPLLGMSLRFDF